MAKILAVTIDNSRTAKLAIRLKRNRYDEILAVRFLNRTDIGPCLMAADLAPQWKAGPH